MVVRVLRPPRGVAGRLRAIVKGRCPVCWDGRIFRGRLTMASSCPVCGLVFEREPGYFTGAMYISYALSVPLLAGLYLLVALLAPGWSFEWTLGTAVALFLPLAPFLFRYSRILWIHLDRAIDAGD